MFFETKVLRGNAWMDWMAPWLGHDGCELGLGLGSVGGAPKIT